MSIAAPALLLAVGATMALGPEDFAGDETQVNTWFINDQRVPTVAADPDGNLVVLWQSSNQAGPGLSLFGQRLDKSGRPRGEEFQVNENTAGRQDGADVVVLPDGGFIVAWQGTGPAREPLAIWARRFDAGGSPAGGEILVHAHPERAQNLPKLAVDAAGRVLVVWESQRDGVPGASADDTVSVLGRWLDSDLNPLTGMFVVNPFTPGAQRWPHMAMAPGGEAVVAWASSGEDGDGWGVFARCIDGPNAPPGQAFQVNQTTVGAQQQPRVAVMPGGGFAVTWWDDTGLSLSENFYRRIQLRPYGADCQPMGDERQINEDDDGVQDVPHIVADPQGGYLVAWQSLPDVGPFAGQGVYARRVDSSGTPVGAQFRLSQETEAFQDHPAIVATPGGGLLGTWESIGQDGSGYGIYARLFLGARAAVMAVLDGGGQAADAGQAFATPLVLRVTDQWGRPLAGAEIRFIAPATGATGHFANGETEIIAVTDADGRVQVTFTGGLEAGDFEVLALTDHGGAQAVFQLSNIGAAAPPLTVPALGLPGVWLLILLLTGITIGYWPSKRS